MISALESGAEINAELRHDLVEALYDLSLYQMIDERKSQRGRRMATKTWLAAAIAMKLVDDHKAMVKQAAWAASPKATTKEHAAIMRAYRKLRSGEVTLRLSALGISSVDTLAEEAASRL